MKLKNYLKNYVRENSQETYGSVLMDFSDYLKKKRKKIDQAEYNDEDVHDYLEALRKRNGRKWKSSAKNTALTIIKGFAKWQMNRIDIGTTLEAMQLEKRIRQRLQNIRDMRKYVESEMPAMALDLPHIEKLLSRATDAHRPIFVCYLYFGVRKMELPTMREINLKARSVVFTTLKNKKQVGSRKLFYPKALDELMKRILENEIRVFYSSSNYGYIFDKYRKLFKTKFCPLSMRHTFRTHMMNALNDEPLVKSLMGHKVEGAAGHYDESFDREIKKAMQKDHYLIKSGVIK